MWRACRKRRQLGRSRHRGTQRPRVTIIDQLWGAIREGFHEEVRIPLKLRPQLDKMGTQGEGASGENRQDLARIDGIDLGGRKRWGGHDSFFHAQDPALKH